MKRYNYLIIGVALLVSCERPIPKKQPANTNPFVTEVRLKTTPVKDQGRSDLCWLYAMLATIETEHIMQGDSVNLSTDYMARQFLLEQTRRYYLSKGRQPISMRGMNTMLISLLQTSGAEPYDSYYHNGAVNYHKLMKELEHITDIGIGRRAGLAWTEQNANALFDKEIGYLPRIIAMLGAEYTPLEFAHSVCRKDEYVAMTSFTHHPFYQWFVLETPDNKNNDQFYNVPIDTLMQSMERSIRAGHPVCWEGDISERGFSFAEGVAHLQHEGLLVTQEHRQTSFERFATTDDHCMELMGIAHDRKGNRFFIAKNSWGTGNPYGGYMYLSFNYVKLKTIAILEKRKD